MRSAEGAEEQEKPVGENLRHDNFHSDKNIIQNKH